MREELARLGQAELRDLYAEVDPAGAARFGVHPADLEEWERWRKYAYSRYWENRLDDRQPLSVEEIQEWQEYVQLDFLNNVACSVIGDAARRSLLSADALRVLSGTAGLTPYASRQLQARIALSRLSLGPELLDELLDLKAIWALHELLERELREGELSLFEAAAQDKRVSRVERHHLREALRERGKRASKAD